MLKQDKLTYSSIRNAFKHQMKAIEGTMEKKQKQKHKQFTVELKRNSRCRLEINHQFVYNRFSI